MKSSLSLILLSATTVILPCGLKAEAATPINNKSFEQWCLQKNSLPTETRTTVETMLKAAGTQDCRLADSKLNGLSILNLNGNQISDVKPLASLTNLTDLNLSFNQISDVKPLANLTNLTELYLWDNQISDVKPLAVLKNLSSLDLSNNPIIEKVCPVKYCRF